MQDIAEDLVAKAVAALAGPGPSLYAALDELPAPIYVTDQEGVVIHFNPACVDFAGRTPVPGQDRWCVTWKLYTDDGQFLPHDRCPMAEAIVQKRAVRGLTAIAERPDGTRVHFMPYPTPLFDEGGSLRGAVNVLIDITDRRQAAALRNQAARCERLSREVTDPAVRENLLTLAHEYLAKAMQLERKQAGFPD